MKGGRHELLAVVRPCIDHRSKFDRQYIASQAYSAVEAKKLGAPRDGSQAA